MPRALSRLVILAVCLIPQGVVGSGPGPMVLAVDAAASQTLIEVGKTGMLGFAGHAHEVAAADVHGRITFDRRTCSTPASGSNVPQRPCA